ncbi:putative 1-phosphatidylinositol-4-phosphate 5-kinase [Helianthus anomalus]
MTDFDLNEKFLFRFPPKGSKVTPALQSGDFMWKDYCPIVLLKIYSLTNSHCC